MEKQPISKEVIDLSAERMNRESRESIGRIAVRSFESNFDGLDEEYQEMNDHVLMMNHDHYVDAGPEYSVVLNKIKKELSRRQLEY